VESELNSFSTVHLSEQWRVHSPQEKNAGKSRRRMQEKQIKLTSHKLSFDLSF
jgi:hypothetical protein